MVKTYDAKSLELAQHFLAEDSHRPNWADECHRLALDIQQAVEDFFDYDGAPYCSYGHKTKASCDCGPIADNE